MLLLMLAGWLASLTGFPTPDSRWRAVGPVDSVLFSPVR